MCQASKARGPLYNRKGYRSKVSKPVWAFSSQLPKLRLLMPAAAPNTQDKEEWEGGGPQTEQQEKDKERERENKWRHRGRRTRQKEQGTTKQKQGGSRGEGQGGSQQRKRKRKRGLEEKRRNRKGGERERGMFPELLLRSWWPGAGPRREVHRKNIPGCMPLCFSIWFLIVARPWFGMGRLAFVSAWKSRFWKFSR